MKKLLNNIKMPREWSAGLLDCCSAGFLTCLLGWCCYPIQIGLNANKLGESFLMCCCPIEGHFMIRSKIRSEQGIEGSLVKDCCILYWCHNCAAVQEANEIEKVYAKQPV